MLTNLSCIGVNSGKEKFTNSLVFLLQKRKKIFSLVESSERKIVFFTSFTQFIKQKNVNEKINMAF
jgi:hypothetical protein